MNHISSVVTNKKNTIDNYSQNNNFKDYSKTIDEIWQPVADYPTYEVSSLGNVKNSVSGYLLKPSVNAQGYLFVSIFYDNKAHFASIHRLVAGAFCGRLDGQDLVNHKNGNKSDNRASNLEWCNPSENIKHTYSVLGRKGTGGGKKNKISVKQADAIIAQALDLINNPDFKPYFFNTLYKIGPTNFYEAMDFARKTPNIKCRPCFFVKRLKEYRDGLH